LQPFAGSGLVSKTGRSFSKNAEHANARFQGHPLPACSEAMLYQEAGQAGIMRNGGKAAIRPMLRRYAASMPKKLLFLNVVASSNKVVRPHSSGTLIWNNDSAHRPCIAYGVRKDIRYD